MQDPRILSCWSFLLAVCLLPACEKITVGAVTVADVVLTPSEGSLLPGGMLQLTADAVDASGNPLPDRTVSWSSDDESIVTVDADGRARAHWPGTVRVWASIDEQEAFATIVVHAPRIEVSETSIGFQAPAQASDRLSRTLHITGEGLMELEVRVAYPQGAANGWLEARLDGPHAPAVVTFTVRTEGLDPGTYPAVLRVMAPAAENSPRLVPVSLRIADVGGGGGDDDDDDEEEDDRDEDDDDRDDDDSEDDDIADACLLQDEDFDGDLRLDSGERCVLEGVRVRGNLRISKDTELRASDLIVDGNMEAKEFDEVRLLRARIDGNILLKDGGEAEISDSRIDGNATIRDNRGGGSFTGTRVEGDVTVSENRGLWNLRSNRIDGNLECRGNHPAPEGRDNDVRGDREGQCRSP